MALPAFVLMVLGVFGGFGEGSVPKHPPKGPKLQTLNLKLLNPKPQTLNSKKVDQPRHVAFRVGGFGATQEEVLAKGCLRVHGEIIRRVVYTFSGDTSTVTLPTCLELP